MIKAIILTAFGGAMFFGLELVAFSLGVLVGREVAHKDDEYIAGDDDGDTVLDPHEEKEK